MLLKNLRAFPSSNDGGMSMLHYFAAKVLPAIILKNKDKDVSTAEECEEAYYYAEMMLTESNKYGR